MPDRDFNSAQSVELGIRAAHVAKSALDILGTHGKVLAKMQFQQLVLEIKQLDDFLTKAGE